MKSIITIALLCFFLPPTCLTAQKHDTSFQHLYIAEDDFKTGVYVDILLQAQRKRHAFLAATSVEQSHELRLCPYSPLAAYPLILRRYPLVTFGPCSENCLSSVVVASAKITAKN